jgi:eukaryotic-like serine/threonine-protein kinase
VGGMKPLVDPARTGRCSWLASVGNAREQGGWAAGYPPASLEARLVTGRYRLRALLGRGGMGRGWLAEDELLRRLVALKQDILSGPTCVGSYSAAPDRLLIEACAAATVNHKGAITIYDVVTDDDRNWIVMEPPFGRTLAEVIAAEGPLPVAQVTNIGLGLLDVLQAAHRVGILHCDVKPPNVHLCTTGGWCLPTSASPAAWSTSPATRRKCWPPAPSTQRRSGSVAANRNRLPTSFSLGVTLFAAVEGKPPFNGTSLFDAVVAVVDGEPTPLLHAGPLRPVIEGLLAKNPADRLTGEQARTALLDLQHEHQLCAGLREGLQEFA